MADHQPAPGRSCHGRLGLMVVRFSLEQFSEVFRIRDAAGRPYILIGGQAVNYWAERYLPTEPTLRKLLPFHQCGH
jgi:hypothetical protein